MATIQQMAQWIRANQDKIGTPEFQTVAGAYAQERQRIKSQVESENQQWMAERTDPTQGMSSTHRALAGAGKAFTDIGRGVGQAAGIVPQEAVDASRQRDAPLMQTGAGKTGNFVGNVAAFAPTAMIPGANTLTGAVVAGSMFGAAQPTATGESRMLNTAIGGAAGLAGQAIGNKLASALQGRAAARATRQATNAPRDRILREAIDAGYSVTPDQAGAGVLARLMQALSGKYKTQEIARLRNQPVTNALARRAIGAADDMPLTDDALRTVRQQAFNTGYAPVRNTGVVRTDATFLDDLAKIADQYSGAAKDFPGAVKPDVQKLVDSVLVDQFDAGSGVDMIRILRDQADAAYRAGDNALGRAAKEAAGALEGQLERHLGAVGPDMLDSFRNARQTIAKTYSLSSAKDAAGNINARALANQLSRGKPLSGELRQIAEFGDQFANVARMPDAASAGPLTIFDLGLGGGAAATTGSVAPLAIPAGRVASRSLLMSRPVQKAMAQKSYDPALIEALLGTRTGGALVRALPAGGVPFAGQ